MESEALSYALEEIRSYLPAGWEVAGEGGGGWDSARRAWRVRVHDGAGTEWDLEVRAADAARRGRHEALRETMARLQRTALR